MTDLPLLWLLLQSVKPWVWYCGVWVADTGGGTIGYRIGDWIHLDAIQRLVYHASAVITALVLSAVVGFVIQRLMRDGPVKRLIIWIDEIFVALVILFLVAEAGLHFWQK